MGGGGGGGGYYARTYGYKQYAKLWGSFRVQSLRAHPRRDVTVDVINV